jgi:hypothetical protein
MSSILKQLEYDDRVFSFPYFDLVPELTQEELDGLEESMRKFGVLDPIKHTHDDVVIDGYNRLHLGKKIGLPLTAFTLKELPQELTGEELENLVVQLRFARSEPSYERRVLMAHRLHNRQWSNRRIADAICVGEASVRRYLEEPGPEAGPTAPGGAVEETIGKDGKKRPAKMPKKEAGPAQDADTPVVVTDESAERTDVAAGPEPTDDPAPAPSPAKPAADAPLDVDQLLKDFRLHYGKAFAIADKLGRAKQTRKMWHMIFNEVFEIEAKA